jgi:protocatechuate 3,4-dioxygenase beta subunit
MNRFKYLAMAALVAFAACDEGEETVITPPVTGSITGVVTIDGTGASGVTVSLSSGATATTDGAGSYSFSAVEAGAYTVTISGFASDATFSSTAQAATITTAGQVVNVNFSGAYVRTSAILGNVSAGGAGLANVNVSIGAQSTTTDANGQYSFSGLRAGDYTVTISGFDASLYLFASTSQTVTVGAGDSKVVSFSGDLQATAKIGGFLYIDELPKNDMFDSSEEALAVAVGNEFEMETDENGEYWFTDLVPGTYRVSIDAADADIPDAFALGSLDEMLVTVTVGATGPADWPFDIIAQTIAVYAFTGLDGVAVGFSPIEDWDIDLYDTDANANAAGAAGLLGSGTTDEMGGVMFDFARADDVGPGGPVDNIVYARAAFPAPPGFKENGEQIIEIKYATTTQMGMAPDTFDARVRTTNVRVTGLEIDGDPLESWKMQASIDSTGAINSAAMDTAGVADFKLGLGGIAAAYGDMFYFRVRTAQSNANGHGWEQTPTADDGDVGMAEDRFLSFEFDGFTLPSDTIHIGTEHVKYTDADITVRLHHELDDSEGAAFTADDNFTGIGNYEADLEGPGGKVTATMPFLAAPAGEVTFANVAVDSMYTITANRLGGKTMLISDEAVTVELDGSDQEAYIAPLEGAAGESTFAHKFTNNWMSGVVDAADGTLVEGLHVRVMYAPENIGGFQDTTVMTSAAGAFATNKNLLDGPYLVSVADSSDADGLVWSFFDTLVLATGPHPGSDDNMDERSGARDLEGAAHEQIVRFRAERMNTEIHGVVVNDRDADYNTLDPQEALSGVTIDLYNDADGDKKVDEDDDLVVSTTTTDGDGAYSFMGLREGDYIVAANSTATATVLRELASDGTVTDMVGVETEAGTPEVGTTDPWGDGRELPRWDYTKGEAAVDLGNGGVGGGFTTRPAHFSFLFSTGTITGVVTDGTDPVSGVTVTVTRCQTAPSAPSPPAIEDCNAKHGSPSPWIVNVPTNASGAYSVSGLLEGVYQIDVAPATGGLTDIDVPAGLIKSYLATLVGDNDVETAPDFEIS